MIQTGKVDLKFALNDFVSDKDLAKAGVKYDQGKNRLGLVLSGFANALQEVGEIGTAGAIKYSDNGWLEVENAYERYLDAMFRHLFKHLSGETNDPDSGQRHLAHMCWNALAIVELTSKEPIDE